MFYLNKITILEIIDEQVVLMFIETSYQFELSNQSESGDAWRGILI